ALGRRGDGGNRRGHRRGRGGLLQWSRRGPVLRAVVEVGRLPLPGLARRTTPLRAEIAVAVAGIGLRGGRRRRGRSRRRVVLRKRLTLLGDVAERLGRGIRDRRRRRRARTRGSGLRGARGGSLALPDLTPRERLILVAGHVVVLRYRWCLEMYCTTPSGTKYHTGKPRPTRSRHSVEEIARAGTSSELTPASGNPRMSKACPGRDTATK